MMREASSLAAESPLMGWSHLLFLVMGLVSSRTTGAFPVHDSNPLLNFSDQVRLRHLYAANEDSQTHLQITPGGEVSGSLSQTLYSLLEIKAVKPGILVIRGKKSGLYLCMDHSLHLYGSEAYKEEDCNFREVPLKDGYVLYFSEKHRASLALKASKGPPLTQFLPMQNTVPLEEMFINSDHFESLRKRILDVESDDPFNTQSEASHYGHVLD
ncbi:fibroblast growth factor 21-like [Lissotriton helveticus]